MQIRDPSSSNLLTRLTDNIRDTENGMSPSVCTAHPVGAQVVLHKLDQTERSETPQCHDGFLSSFAVVSKLGLVFRLALLFPYTVYQVRLIITLLRTFSLLGTTTFTFPVVTLDLDTEYFLSGKLP